MSSFHTLAVHAGERMPRPDFTPVATPIYHSAAYIYEELDALDGVFAGTREGPVYARYGNPTLTALEAAVAALEGGEAASAMRPAWPRSTARCWARARGPGPRSSPRRTSTAPPTRCSTACWRARA